MKIKCVDPCTFFSSDRDIRIFDDKKNIFYLHPNKERAINFNLPVGVYYTENKISQRPFVPYEKFEKPEKFISPLEFEIIIKPNPKKATISLNKKTIVVDPKVAYHNYKPCTIFVLGHEIAHTAVGGNIVKDGVIVFNAEKECDRLSKNWMLANGYNPTQINFAVKLILSSEDRKTCMRDQTIQTKYRR